MLTGRGPSAAVPCAAAAGLSKRLPGESRGPATINSPDRPTAADPANDNTIIDTTRAYDSFNLGDNDNFRIRGKLEVRENQSVSR